jgi:hypothetical protein
MTEWLPDGGEHRRGEWEEGHISVDGIATPYHAGQVFAYNSPRRIIAMIAGTQGGKTSFGPWWLWKKIRLGGGGDYLAVTSSYDLFKLKMLPSIRECFEEILGIGRYWAGDKVLELAHPEEGFLAKRSSDPMWGRIILRSAESSGGLESATAKAAWLDEAGQEKFKVGSWRAIKRRLALNRGDILITTTLYVLGWLDQEVMGPAEESGVEKRYKVGPGELTVIDSEKANTALIQFDSIVNPEYPVEEFEEAREMLPEEEFDMQYRGRVGKMRTLIYDCFDVKRDVVEAFEIPGNWTRWVGMDFGGTNTVAVYFAEDPETGILYGYRLYKEGKLTAAEHAAKIQDGEEHELIIFGGDRSEGQWRKEFGSAGLDVYQPPDIGLEVGLLRVYAAKKKGLVKYFEDLWPIVDENLRYKRKVDEYGNVTDDIVAKKSFHYMDGERYIVGYVKGMTSSYGPNTTRYA